jgi:prepilin-type N-terminal cleavage/methylation domain-containing protein
VRKNTCQSSRLAFTLIELIVVIAIIVILVSVVFTGETWIVQAIWYFIAGWGYFILRKSPQAEPQTDAVVAGLLALLLLVVVLHWLMRRIMNRPAIGTFTQRTWSVRSTAALVGVIVLLFAAGVSAIGITHQTTWLATTDQPRTQRSSFTGRDAHK